MKIRVPAGSQPIDLWAVLHDAYLKSIVSDRVSRTVTLSVAQPSLQTGLGQPVDTAFLLRCETVDTAQVLCYLVPPIVSERPAGMEWNEWARLFTEHCDNGWWQSEDWAAYEASLQKEKATTEIQSAVLLQHENGVTLCVRTARGPHGLPHSIVIDASLLHITGESGTAYPLADFIDLGEQSWERDRQRANRAQEGV